MFLFSTKKASRIPTTPIPTVVRRATRTSSDDVAPPLRITDA
jgi:hypothetical protein